MKKMIGLTLLMYIIAGILMTNVSCSAPAGDQSGKIPPPAGTQPQYSAIAEDFIKNSSTFKFDGIDGSVELLKGMDTADGSVAFTIKYQTRQPGHGDRSGLILAQVITTHTAEITIKDSTITSAVCDGSWDMLTQKEITGKQ